METTVNLVETPWKWFDLWRNAFLHPTQKTYSRIGNDPRAKTTWALIWAAVGALVSWIVGPHRSLLAGYIANVFGGPRSYYYVSVFGTPIAVALAVLGLALIISILHGLASVFQGQGTFRQLFFTWAVMQLPFLFLIGLVSYLPSIFIPSTREFYFSRIGLFINGVKLLTMLGIYLYLCYAQIVAFSAVEKFGIGKGFGIVILAMLVISVLGVCLSAISQVAVSNLFRYGF